MATESHVDETAPKTGNKKGGKKLAKRPAKPAIADSMRAFASALAELLRDRAQDNATLVARVGPKSLPAVKATLLHIADVLTGGKEFKAEPRPVLKRYSNEPAPQPFLHG